MRLPGGRYSCSAWLRRIDPLFDPSVVVRLPHRKGVVAGEVLDLEVKLSQPQPAPMLSPHRPSAFRWYWSGRPQKCSRAEEVVDAAAADVGAVVPDQRVVEPVPVVMVAGPLVE